MLNACKDEIADIRVNSPQDETACPSVLNISFLGTRGEVLLHTLEQDGIFVSTGSACASHHTGDSHVLQAMRVPREWARGAIRFSLGTGNTEQEIDETLAELERIVSRLRERRAR